MRRAFFVILFHLLFVPVAWLVRRVHDVLDQGWDAERETYFT